MKKPLIYFSASAAFLLILLYAYGGRLNLSYLCSEAPAILSNDMFFHCKENTKCTWNAEQLAKRIYHPTVWRMFANMAPLPQEDRKKTYKLETQKIAGGAWLCPDLEKVLFYDSTN